LDDPAALWEARFEHVRAKRVIEAEALHAQIMEHGCADRVRRIRETLDETASTLARSQTPHTDNLIEPVRALIAWLRPSES
jgi:hypothetical protein